MHIVDVWPALWTNKVNKCTMKELRVQLWSQ
jgi:hypothetical protein